ncbi:lipase family protein [Williamsia soli]|uniref:lipase family protein n=1 Tax=Williamsia soli TaxID=364929 RepID=UPI001A9F1389|nr:lipase family protein [Williamsia soli]
MAAGKFMPVTFTRHVFVAVAAIVSLVLVSCGSAQPATPADDPLPTTAPVEYPEPGDVVDARDWVSTTDLAPDLRGVRMLYRSTDTSGKPNVVSGTVFQPEGSPPGGGWPVVALGHGSTGINTNCAPSLTGNLYGLARLVTTYLRAGMAVTLADYAGLGSESGPHPYLDPYSAARTMIDSVRAIRQVYPQVSTSWVTYGISQGAGASWAANEMAASYAPDLRLRGAVAQVPPTSKVPVVDLAAAGALTSEQQGSLQWMEESLARRNPDMNRDDYRRGALAQQWDALSACAESSDREQAAKLISAPDFIPASPAATARLRELMQQLALPRAPLSAPLLVLYGGQDKFNDPAWTSAAIRDQCFLGGPVTVDLQPTAGHGTVKTTGILPYLVDRLVGAPVRDDCRS